MARDGERLGAGTLEIIRGLEPASLGLAFWWAWVWLAFFSPVLFSSSQLADSAYKVSVVSVAVSCIVLAFASVRWPNLFSTRFRVLTAMVFSAGTFLMIAWVDVSLTWVFALGSVLTGIGSGALIVLWGLFYKTMEPKRSLACLALSFALAACLYFVMNGFPPHLAVAVQVLMPVLSVACLFSANKSQAQERAAEDAASESAAPESAALEEARNSGDVAGIISWRILMGIAMFAFSSGFVISISSFNGAAESFELAGSLQVLGNGVAALGVLALMGLKGFRFELFNVCRVVLPLMAVGFLVLTSFSGLASTAGLVLAFVASGLFELVVWSTLAHQAYENPNRAAYVFGIGNGGKLLGWAAGSLVVSWIEPTFSQSQSAFMVVVLLVVAATVFLGERAFRQQEPMAQGATGSVTSGVGEIARQYGLTPRETEVCELLAKGRSIPYIEQELHVSHSTVVTHTRHIYEKTGVHDRQELIDMVEQRSA